MKKTTAIFVTLAGLTIGLPVLAGIMRGKQGVSVDTLPVAEQVVRSSVLASGTVGFREQVRLSSELSGKVLSVQVREGDTVRKGQLLIALEAEQYQAVLEQQQADARLRRVAISQEQTQLQNLERQVARLRALQQDRLVDRSTFEAEENKMKVARLNVQSRRESLAQSSAILAQGLDTLRRTQIRSPLDGVITRLDVKAGESVIPGTTNIPGTVLAEVSDTSSVIAELKVDETDIARIAIGQRAAIHAAAYPDQVVHGVVERIAASAVKADGQQNLSFAVNIRLDAAEASRIKPGTSCRAEIYIQSSDKELAVPLQAVLYEDAARAGKEKAYVFVDEAGTAVRRDLTLGLSSDSHVVVKAGLKPSERVVVGPFRTLRLLKDGDAVGDADRDSSRVRR
ncbi:efflux RND transporter periplasmic adaptor subunit [Xanthomonas sp. BRIP62415]|uniref:efflux RND transporter periplasmic adaptor subunit n=1 Tax=Xanthomonas sp. BRIP62415 TaxID=2182390 RepID=UPI0013E07AB0|nr:efflux RND transporter periplasmic adaptor subunit [Xanthomonas sp. BRIP62415]